MPFSLAPIHPLVARAAGGKPNARRTSRRAALRCLAEGVGNNDDASDSVAQITGDWRQFRCAPAARTPARREGRMPKKRTRFFRNATKIPRV